MNEKIFTAIKARGYADNSVGLELFKHNNGIENGNENKLLASLGLYEPTTAEVAQW